MRTDQVLQWVREHILPSGGLEAWQGCEVAYPEVTGYILPSLKAHGADDVAVELAGWLVSKQQQNGSWLGLDERQHAFDTAAVVQGLMVMEGDLYRNAVQKAMRWLYSMRREDGFLRKDSRSEMTDLYLCRASWIIGDRATVAKYAPSPSWGFQWGVRNRSHYIAYALEGLQAMGFDITDALAMSKTAVKASGIMPFWVKNGWLDDGDDDAVATLQFALLYARQGWTSDAARLVDAVESKCMSGGAVWQGTADKRELSWGAKYYLDCAAELDGK